MNRIERCIAAIKGAYISHVPIVWLITNDKEEASKVAESFAIDHLGGMFDSDMFNAYRYSSIVAFDSKKKDLAKESVVFFDWIGRPFNENNATSNANVQSCLESFVNMFLNLQTEAEVRQNENLTERAAHSMAIIASPYQPKLSWLNHYIRVIHIPLPDDLEIKKLLEVFFGNNISVDNSFKEKLSVNFRGFSAKEISQVLLYCQHAELFDNNEYDLILNEIWHKKREKLEGFPGLKWEMLDDDVPQATGLGVITQWLEERRDIFIDPVKSYHEGYDIPKGLLVTGIPGSGKSLMAKCTARILSVPLLAMDLGDIQEGIIGKSEEHMANALRMVDAMAPCVLWVDEIEKAFAGSESSQSDGGVMRRMFGKFLTWMQEKKSYCFVFATANDITNLPPELFRSERFDEKFFNFMPTVEECAQIFVANLKQHNKRYEDANGRVLFDGAVLRTEYWINILNKNVNDIKLTDDGAWVDGVRPKTKLFTGADISSLVKLLKFRILNDRTNASSDIYGNKGAIQKAEVDKTIDKIIDGFMPYGQTNLIDIAKCFVTLTKKRFSAASSEIESIVRFEDYDETKHAIKYDPKKLSDTSSQTNTYNRTLYRSLVGAINSRENMRKDNNVQSENKQ